MTAHTQCVATPHPVLYCHGQNQVASHKKGRQRGVTIQRWLSLNTAQYDLTRTPGIGLPVEIIGPSDGVRAESKLQ